MWNWLRQRRLRKERQQLERHHLRLLEEARDLQRAGDIQAFAAKTAEAESVGRSLDRLLATPASTRSPLGGG